MLIGMDALLSVEGLSYRYGDRVAVDTVDFTVARGEVFGLLGPNGAGKTTAISCLCGILKPAAGTLRLHGKPFDPRASGRDRALLGVVPQELALYDGLTGRENLVLIAKLYGVADAHAATDRGLALAGLQSRADERVKNYSGGMKRRLNLAAALLHEPELALLDEPMVGVDPQSRHHIFETLEGLKQSGRAMIYTSHSMDEVERLCDRVAILDRGQLVGVGTAAELAAQAGAPDGDLEATFLKLTGHSLRDGSSASAEA